MEIEDLNRKVIFEDNHYKWKALDDFTLMLHKGCGAALWHDYDKTDYKTKGQIKRAIDRMTMIDSCAIVMGMIECNMDIYDYDYFFFRKEAEAFSKEYREKARDFLIFDIPNEKNI